MTHVPAIVPAQKMDTPEGIWRGACSCGWLQSGPDSERGAIQASNQHAAAKNAQARLDPTGRPYLVWDGDIDTLWDWLERWVGDAKTFAGRDGSVDVMAPGMLGVSVRKGDRLVATRPVEGYTQLIVVNGSGGT